MKTNDNSMMPIALLYNVECFIAVKKRYQTLDIHLIPSFIVFTTVIISIL